MEGAERDRRRAGRRCCSPLRLGGRAAVPGALGRRLLRQLRIDGGKPARRAVVGMSGFGFWSHDIGGFENTAPAHVYKRWCAFGLLSSHSRLHGSKSYRVPWAYDDESCEVVRHFTQLKCRMMPYLYRQAALANECGTPMLRAMMLEFPDDPACRLSRPPVYAGRFGPGGAGVPRGRRSAVYLPEGHWTHLWHNDELPGSRWHKQHHDAH